MNGEKRRFVQEVRNRLFDKDMTFADWCRQYGFKEGLARAALLRHAMSPHMPQGFKSYKIIKALEQDTGMKICGGEIEKGEASPAMEALPEQG
jgi:hypothetical protein